MDLEEVLAYLVGNLLFGNVLDFLLGLPVGDLFPEQIFLSCFFAVALPLVHPV